MMAYQAVDSRVLSCLIVGLRCVSSETAQLVIYYRTA